MTANQLHPDDRTAAAAADALASVDGASASPDSIRATADDLIRDRRWGDAASLLARVADRSLPDDLKLNLSRNLDALGRHRPNVYELLVAQPSDERYGIAAAPNGMPTILARRADGTAVSFAGGADPLANARSAMTQAAAASLQGESLAICGAGDGYLIKCLAADRRELFLGMEQAIFLVEPEPQVLLLCLMLHDYTGPLGPIEQGRVHWFVGADWSSQLRDTTDGDAFLGVPNIMLRQGLDGPQIAAELQAHLRELSERDAEIKAEVDRHYANVSPDDTAALFGPNPPRQPRVLLLTTRFSTVLQYSTRDTAEAFASLGWDARVLIEPTPAHRLYRASFSHVLRDYKPDLVFQIDHLRHEHRGLFPANLPFACWVQDHLANLISRAAAAQVGPTDFVLLDTAATYEAKYGYPARQLVALPKLTKPAQAFTSPAQAGNGPDLVFVSNASKPPEAILAAVLATYDGDGASRDVLVECARHMTDAYAQGGALATYFGDIKPLIRETAQQLNVKLEAERFDWLAKWLCHPFNDALYRQQALRWAATVAHGLGLTLELYGSGWDQHPEFAAYARGPIAYGQPLADLTRRAKINLQIVPYLCLHQRLLDGLMAGGFFLVRAHPADVTPPALIDFLHANVPDSARTTAEVLRSLPRELHGQFDVFRRAAMPPMCTTGDEDVVRMARDWQEAGQLVPGGVPIDRFDAVAFHDAASLARQIARYADDAAAREEIVRAQRADVAGRLTYEAGIRRAIARMADVLEDNAMTAAARPAEAA